MYYWSDKHNVLIKETKTTFVLCWFLQGSITLSLKSTVEDGCTSLMDQRFHNAEQSFARLLNVLDPSNLQVIGRMPWSAQDKFYLLYMFTVLLSIPKKRVKVSFIKYIHYYIVLSDWNFWKTEQEICKMVFQWLWNPSSRFCAFCVDKGKLSF